MLSQSTSQGIKAAMIAIVALGIVTLGASTLMMSSFFAIIGFSLIFWGVILLYIIPTKRIFSELLNAAIEPSSSNIERILTEHSLSQPGIYFSSENNFGLLNGLKPFERMESVLVFIPRTQFNFQENNPQPKNSVNGGVFITPPGLAPCRMMEKQISKSFSKIDIEEFKRMLPTI